MIGHIRMLFMQRDTKHSKNPMMKLVELINPNLNSRITSNNLAVIS